MTQSGNLNDLNASTGALSYLELAPGARVKRTDGAILEVLANPRDGAWLLIRIVENPNDPSSVGTEDMVFFIDVEGMA